MAVLRMRDGDSIEVQEAYPDASTKFGNAVHHGLRGVSHPNERHPACR
jgi:hypothetical protein